MQEPTYKDFFLHDLDFAVEYISLYYPFSETQIRLYMQHLKKGDAYYPIYENDTNNLKVPALGLCYNKNIGWTDELKAEWQTNTADGSIPLSIAAFVAKYHQYMWEWDLSNHEYTENELLNMEHDHVPHEILHPIAYPHLLPTELFNSYRNRQEILYNESIWEHTLIHVLTEGFMIEVMDSVLRKKPDTDTAHKAALIKHLDTSGECENSIETFIENHRRYININHVKMSSKNSNDPEYEALRMSIEMSEEYIKRCSRMLEGDQTLFNAINEEIMIDHTLPAFKNAGIFNNDAQKIWSHWLTEWRWMLTEL